MEKTLKLSIELVPETSWYNNVRSQVPYSIWQRIRRKSFHEANHKCDVCGSPNEIIDRKSTLECHEIWKYDESHKIQWLVGFQALCPDCHKVKHAGRSTALGEYDKVIKQLMSVNEMTESEATAYYQTSFKVWLYRSTWVWQIDVEYLTEYLKTKYEI